MTTNIRFAAAWLAILLMARPAWAAPAGYVSRTIPLNAPPVGLAFDAAGVLFALENAGFGAHVATLRSIAPNGSFGASFPVAGDDPANFFVGSMAYDSLTDKLLISDNTADGRLYAVDKQGGRQTLAIGIAGIGGIAVRTTGEIFVTTAPFGRAGEVRLIDRVTGASTVVLDDLGFGAGLAVEPSGNLVVQDADAATFAGRLRRLPISSGAGGLAFGTPQPLVEGMVSSAGVVVVGAGDLFTTGVGGLYHEQGSPLVETSFDANGNPGQFATAIAFSAGPQAFSPFAGPHVGRLAYMADFGFQNEDDFVTLLTPARPEDFNSDGFVDGNDLALWRANFGAAAAAIERGDADNDGDGDGADFLRWQRQSPAPASVANAAVAHSAVPEPAAGAFFLLAPFYLLGKTARRVNVKKVRGRLIGN